MSQLLLMTNVSLHGTINSFIYGNLRLTGHWYTHKSPVAMTHLSHYCLEQIVSDSLRVQDGLKLDKLPDHA